MEMMCQYVSHFPVILVIDVPFGKLHS